MRLRRPLGVVLAFLGIAIGAAYLLPATGVAQEGVKPAVGVGSALRNNVATQVLTIKCAPQRGEPRAATATGQFDRDVEVAWVSVVGTDIKFTRSTEKQINRQMFEVDPFVKIVNGRTVEVTGKLGIKDGSGDWDDTYEGTITVAVTAVLTPR